MQLEPVVSQSSQESRKSLEKPLQISLKHLSNAPGKSPLQVLVQELEDAAKGTSSIDLQLKSASIPNPKKITKRNRKEKPSNDFNALCECLQSDAISSKIKQLDLSYNPFNFTDEVKDRWEEGDVSTFVSSLQKLKLTSLNLSAILFHKQPKTASLFLKLIQANSDSLETLILNDCYIADTTLSLKDRSNPSLQQWINALKSCRNLKTLEFQQTCQDAKLLEKFIQILKDDCLPNLTTLTLGRTFTPGARVLHPQIQEELKNRPKQKPLETAENPHSKITATPSEITHSNPNSSPRSSSQPGSDDSHSSDSDPERPSVPVLLQYHSTHSSIKGCKKEQGTPSPTKGNWNNPVKVLRQWLNV